MNNNLKRCGTQTTMEVVQEEIPILRLEVFMDSDGDLLTSLAGASDIEHEVLVEMLENAFETIKGELS